MRTRWSLTFALAVALFFPVVARAQSVAPTDIPKKVDAIFAAFDKPDSPGCALGVIRDAQLVYARGYGMANLELGAAITGSTIFDIGSTSKQFTAAAILLLAQQGKLSLDDDIRKHVPELPAYAKPVTIRHLLHHTSGLRDYLTLWSVVGVDFDGITTEDDALKLIARQKELNFEPGAEYLYSNSGYMLMSVIVRRASGKSLRDFAQENIFTPLGMAHTQFNDDHTRIVLRRATGYAARRAGSLAIAMSGFEQTGDGAVLTSVEDLLLWDRNFYDPKVGGPALIRELLTTGALNSGEKITYARGLTVDKYKGLDSVSHGGSWAGYRAELIRFPSEKLSVACLCNLANANPSRLARQVADVYLADRIAAPATAAASAAKPEPVALTEAERTSKAGNYVNRANGSFWRITSRDGKLWLAGSAGAPEELVALAGGKFRVADWPPSYELAFEQSKPEGPPQVRFTRDGSAEVLEPVASFEPTPAQLGEFTGIYYSEELDVTYVITVDGTQLSLGPKGRRFRAATPAYRDTFAGPGGGQFEFTRDAQGRITGFLVHAGRIRNVRFQKANNQP